MTDDVISSRKEQHLKINLEEIVSGSGSGTEYFGAIGE